MVTYRIVLADDHFLIRQGLRSILAGKEDLEIAGEAGDGLDALFLLDRLKPDLVLLDISMPHLQGIDTARQIKMKYPEMKILILTMHREREYIYEAISAGGGGLPSQRGRPKRSIYRHRKDSQRQGLHFTHPHRQTWKKRTNCFLSF